MGSEILTEVVTAPKEYNDTDLYMMSLMYSVATYDGNSVLNYNLDLLYLARLLQTRAFVMKF